MEKQWNVGGEYLYWQNESDDGAITEGWIGEFPDDGTCGGRAHVNKELDFLLLSSYKYATGDLADFRNDLAKAEPWTQTKYWGKVVDVGSPGIFRTDTGEQVSPDDVPEIAKSLGYRAW